MCRLFYCESTHQVIQDIFERLDPSLLVNIFIQEGKDLGERMKNAFSARFSEGL